MKKDHYGFKFWLGWILQFAGSFIAAVLVWTLSLTALFGGIDGFELSATWAVAVFGSWFVLMIPFMRKKERIWKRLNDDQEKATDAWLLGMGLFIGSLIAAAFGWSVYFRDALMDPAHQGIHTSWLKAVIGTWLVLLVPFLVLMYLKADAIFKAAVKRQSYQGPIFHSTFVEKTKRMLPESIRRKLKGLPTLLNNAQIGHLKLKNGRIVEHAFVLNGSEILGLYDRDEMDFNASEIEDVELLEESRLPPYEEQKWLRLDGRA